jgi:hypothetical protein
MMPSGPDLGTIEYMQGRRPPGLFGFFAVLLVTGGCVGTAQAQSPAPNQSARERTLLAEGFAQEKLWSWQRRLNLRDWTVAVVVSRASELKPQTLGHIRWDLDKKTAVIRVLDPADYRLPFKAMLDDIELTVVHELIHLDLAPVLTAFQRSEANRLEEEHLVNQMAEALLKLDRQK